MKFNQFALTSNVRSFAGTEYAQTSINVEEVVLSRDLALKDYEEDYLSGVTGFAIKEGTTRTLYLVYGRVYQPLARQISTGSVFLSTIPVTRWNPEKKQTEFSVNDRTGKVMEMGRMSCCDPTEKALYQATLLKVATFLLSVPVEKAKARGKSSVSKAFAE